jgi:hypothetical protein
MTFLLCAAPGELDVVRQKGDAELGLTVSYHVHVYALWGDVRGAVCGEASVSYPGLLAVAGKGTNRPGPSPAVSVSKWSAANSRRRCLPAAVCSAW